MIIFNDWPDKINGGFELFAILFILPSIIRLYKDKTVRGISWLHIFYMSVWGYWNLYYYPFLNQWCSLLGSLFIVTINTIYFLMLVYYTRKEKNDDTK